MSIRFPLAKIPTRAARWSAIHPWQAIGGWLVFVIAAIALASVFSSERPTEADHRVGESGRADTMLEDAGLAQPPGERVLISAPNGRLDRGAGNAAAATVADEMTEVEGVEEVGDPIPSENGVDLLVPVVLTSETVDADPLLTATAAAQDAHPDLSIEQTGDLTLQAAFEDRLGKDLRSAEFISVPIVLFLMLLAFGALIAAGLPVLLAATSVAATIGITAPVSHLVPADPSVDSMIVLIGVAVGVDYSLFYLKRERQEREAGRTTLDAVEVAAETSGHAIVVSGGAVIASLAGLFVLTDATFNSLATGAIVVVAVAVLGSITVLPALLVKLGRWVDRPRIPGLWRLNRRIGRGGISGRLIGPVVRHPVAALVIAAMGIGALAVPALGMKTHEENIEAVPADIVQVQTYKKIIAAYPGEGTTAMVVAAEDPAERMELIAALKRLAGAAAETGDFTAAGRVRASQDGGTSVIELAMPYAEGDDRIAAAIMKLRSDLAPDVLNGVAEEWAVGGQAAHELDDSEKRADRLPLLLGFVLLLTSLMMAASFRSIVLGAVSTLLNLASVGVAFGVLVVVFQHGYGESLLDFTSPGFVIDWVPIFVLAVLIGLSMDYHVFVISRIRELVTSGMPTRAAVQHGIADSASVVTSAAAVMVSVFAIFATVSLIEIKMLGVGLAAAILLDATVIRLVVLPAVLVLLGDRVWWPSRPASQNQRVVTVGPPALDG
jgi:RND superfamily putative drug exporter